jgi:crossover junction endodeoxyribonuclease RuvC
MTKKMTYSNDEKVIIGIDPGTVITGYGLISVKGNNFTPIDFGCIKPPAKLKLSERYHIIASALGEILDHYTPAAMAVESQYFAKNAQSVLKLGMVRGVIMVAARQKKIPIYQYSPSSAKKAVVGRGNATKMQVQNMVKALLNLERIPEPDDAADALALAICHAHTLCYYDPTDKEI